MRISVPRGSAGVCGLIPGRIILPLRVITLALLAALVACSKPPEPAPDNASSTPKTTGLESIPPGNPAKYPPFQDMRGWKNPYFVVRDDGIGFVDLSNREVHVLTPEQIPAELVSLGSGAWPYGRVVLVTEASPKNPTDAAKAEIRKNRGLLVGTLKELDVGIQEAP
jgi:streptogramin lyase